MNIVGTPSNIVARCSAMACKTVPSSNFGSSTRVMPKATAEFITTLP